MAKLTSEEDFPITYFTNYLVIELSQCLTLIEANCLQELCFRLIKQIKPNQRIIFNLRKTQAIDNSGMRALLKSQIIFRAYQHELIFQQVSPTIMKILEIEGLTEIFQFDHGSNINYLTFY